MTHTAITLDGINSVQICHCIRQYYPKEFLTGRHLISIQMNIPQDVSLIGFDRFPETDLFKPALTVIEQPIEEIGRTTGELIMRRIAGDNTGFPQRVILEPKMIVRDSVRNLEHRE